MKSQLSTKPKEIRELKITLTEEDLEKLEPFHGERISNEDDFDVKVTGLTFEGTEVIGFVLKVINEAVKKKDEVEF